MFLSPAILFAIMLLAAPAYAQSADELKRIEADLAAQQAAASELAAEEASTQTNLQNLQQKLVQATAELGRQQETAELLEDSLASLQANVAHHQSLLASDRQHLTDLGAVLIQLKRQPPELIPDSSSKRREAIISATVTEINTRQHAVAETLRKLEKLQQQAASQQTRLTQRQEKLQQQQQDLQQLITERQGKLKQTAAEKAEAEQQRAALAEEAKDLRQLIEKISRRPGNFAKQPSQSLPEGWRLPVAGRITRGYGDKDAYGVASDGLVLAAPAGSPIIAPRGGKVAFAGPFRGYGQIVILQHDRDYHSFIAGFDSINVVMGQNLAAGEPLGQLPDKKGTRPELYFELRHKGEAVNPYATARPQKIGSR